MSFFTALFETLCHRKPIRGSFKLFVLTIDCQIGTYSNNVLSKEIETGLKVSSLCTKAIFLHHLSPTQSLELCSDRSNNNVVFELIS